MKAYTVKEVAAASGVSVRTLHYYDEIHLLKPHRDGENGYRIYREEHLLRLQQILFFRELDFPLDEIRSMLDSATFDRIGALNHHKELLKLRAERLQTLLHTIEDTIDRLKGELEMSSEALFEGFDKKKQEAYEKDLVERYGPGVQKNIDESWKRVKDWKPDDYARTQAAVQDMNQRFAAALTAGLAPDSDETQALTSEHFAWVSQFYTPTQEVYAGLGDLYVDHPDFRKLYDAVHPQLAEYLRDAMKIYADRQLGS